MPKMIWPWSSWTTPTTARMTAMIHSRSPMEPQVPPTMPGENPCRETFFCERLHERALFRLRSLWAQLAGTDPASSPFSRRHT